MNAEESKVYFRGLLANVDSSILRMDFNHGFEVDSFSDKEAIEFFSQLEKAPSMTTMRRYFSQLQCFNGREQRMYFINKTLEIPTGNSSQLFSEIMKFDDTLVLGHLEPVIRLMRFFKEGDIRMPAKFYYQIKSNVIQQTMRAEYGRYVSKEPYHLEDSEIADLQSFIQSVKLPFRRDFLNLAFENLELSYEIPDMQLAFLVLMIGLETLLNPSQFEIRHRISRNTAVLLGEDRRHSEEIFAQTKRLYDKRSEIVHSGKRRIIEKEDLLKLRDYLRKAIKEVYRVDREKGEITALLDFHGFGEKIGNP